MASVWRLQLRPGSFRGVSFFCDSHDFEGGRRIVDHVFPYKDQPWTEDLGREQRVYNLNLYVVGDDYFPQRDALLEALEKGGVGVLAHPYLGNKNVEAGKFKASESSTEGGMALISVTFRETGKIPQPTGGTDFFEKAKSAAQRVQIALARAFNSFNSPSPSSYIFESATTMVSAVSDVLNTAANAVPNKSGGISDLAYSIRNLKGNSRALVQRPSQLSAAFQDSVKLLTSSLDIRGLLPENASGRVEVRRDAVAASIAGYTVRQVFQGLIDYGALLAEPIRTTATRRQEARNQDLMRQLVVGTALGEAVIVSAGTDYGTYEDAIAQRDYLVDNIEKLMGDETLDDDTFSALQGLLASAVQSIPDPSGEAPRLSLVRLNDVTPSLVISYDLYENLDYESDIIARNRLKHPGFISPLKPLEVVAGE